MKAHQLLSDRSKWTKQAFARMADGTLCDPEHSKAESFCLHGAVRKCYGRNGFSEAIESVILARARLFPGSDIFTVNDELGYEAVMQVLREADV